MTQLMTQANAGIRRGLQKHAYRLPSPFLAEHPWSCFRLRAAYGGVGACAKYLEISGEQEDQERYLSSHGPGGPPIDMKMGLSCGVRCWSVDGADLFALWMK